jgi:hypothetical protein
MRRFSPSLAVCALGLVALASTAHAQVQPGAHYIGFGAGMAHAIDLDHSALNDMLAAQQLPTHTEAVNTNTLGAKFYVGHRFDRHWAGEIGYSWLGDFDFHGQLVNDPGTVNAQIRGSSLSVAAVGILPHDESLEFFAKAGVGFWHAHMSARGSFSGSAVVSSSVDGSSPLLGMGGLYHFSPQWTVRAEAERLFNFGKADRTGRTDIDLYSVSVQYHF